MLAISTTPFFSVIITTFNRAELLLLALKSLLAQTESDWNAIIIDDGSTDNTEQIIAKYLTSNIIYIKISHSGQAIAKNTGIQNANGKYITFLDSDDMYKITHLESRKQILLNSPEIDFLHGGVEIIGNPFVPDKNDSSNIIHLNNCIIGGTFFIKSEVFTKTGLFENVEYGEDFEFYTRAVETGLNIRKTDIKTYIYNRNQSDSICNNQNHQF
ncbi:MAG: glycosyltransferase family A protein [Bacteroidota bacterium]|jgi:glycosyltransferase involved in cell wall biosynthesis